MTFSPSAQLLSVCKGTSYSLWLRARLSLLIITSVALTVPVFPLIWGRAEWFPAAGVVLGSAVLFTLTHIVGVITYGGRDLGASESTFPRYLMTLPANARTLAAVPMFWGVITMALIWLVMKLIADRLLISAPGIVAPLWPAALLVAIVAWLQAVSWMPFGVPFLRVFVALGVLGAFVTFAGIAANRGMPPWLLAVTFTIATVTAYPTASIGIARARRGDGATMSWAWLPRLRRSRAVISSRAPFASPMEAQVWMEVRRNILLVPFVGAGMPLAVAATTVFFGQRSTPLLVDGHLIPPILIAVGVAIVSPMLAGGMHGPTMGKFDAWSKPVAISPFIAIRPLTTAQLVAAKLIAAAVAAVITWTIVIVIMVLWALVPRELEGHSLAGAAAMHLTWTIGIAAVVALAWLMLNTWKQMAQSLFICLYGRPWFSNVVTIGGMAAFSLLFVALAPFMRDVHLRQVLPTIAKWLVYSIVLLKLVIGAMLIAISLRHRLLSAKQITTIIYTWLVLVAAYFILLILLLPDSMKPGIMLLIAIAMLLPPGARVLAAVPALHANRHR
jgi:hypothetical protein